MERMQPIDPATAAVQRRTVATLVGSQMLGGVGVSTGLAVATILAEDILGSADLAGLASTSQVLGGALLTVPMAMLMARWGRRIGLVGGYLVATAGATVAILASLANSFPMLIAGAVLFGAATASNSQARFAAADLADPGRRGRDLSVVVWATTVGAVLGPNLLGPAKWVAAAWGIPVLAGPFIFSLVGFGLAGALLVWRLRPDPLLMARQIASDTAATSAPAHGSVWRGIRVVARHRGALAGLIAVAIGHTVMVGVMVMTPLHMHHGGAELELVGFVISVHVLGMYAFSPLVGLLVDRVGGMAVTLLGAGILVTACLVSAQAAPGWSAGLVVGLFLLGLGWSCTLVAGSTLLTAGVPQAERPGAQGASDVVMGFAAAGGSALSGVVVAGPGYGTLGVLGAALAVALAVAMLILRTPVRIAA